MKPIYLDHSATTPVHPEVLTAMISFFANHFGNPSSIHREGRLAREAVEGARARVAALIGAAPAEIALRDLASQMTHLRTLRDLLEERIRAEIPDIRVHGHPLERLPQLLSVSFAGVSGEALVRELDLRGIAVSAGSACTAGSTRISHVLAALGMPEALAVGTVRFSLGRDNTEEEIGQVVSILKALVEKRRILAELEGSVGGRGCR
jgi:cysteine desulfurase